MEGVVIEPASGGHLDHGHAGRLLPSHEPVKLIHGCMFWGDGEGSVGVTDAFELLACSFTAQDGTVFRGFWNDKYQVGLDVQSGLPKVWAAVKPADQNVQFNLYTSPNRDDVTLFISAYLTGLTYGYAKVRAREKERKKADG